MTSTGRKKPVSQSVETLLVAFFFIWSAKGPVLAATST